MRRRLRPGAFILFASAVMGTSVFAQEEIPTLPLPVSAGDIKPGAAPLPVIPADQAPPTAGGDNGVSPVPSPLPPLTPEAGGAAPGTAIPPATPPRTASLPAGPFLPKTDPPIRDVKPASFVVEAREDALQTEALPDAVAATPPGKTIVVPAGQVPVFSGKVIADTALTGAQVGIVSLKGSPWTNPNNFAWFPVKADGTFLARADRDPDAGKALVVNAPGHPLTFVPWNFSAREASSDVVINIPVARHVVVSAVGPDGVAASSMTVEAFDAHDYRSAAGTTLVRQRLGIATGPGSGVPLDLPDGPVGLYVSAQGLAAYYQIVDTAKAPRIEFRLLREGSVGVQVVKNGAPAAGVVVMTACPNAPFSARRRTTDGQGRFQLTGLAPGEYTMTAEGGRGAARVRAGQNTTATLTLDSRMK